MNKKSFFLVAALSVTALSAQAQSGIAFVTDVKGEAALDSGKASLMAEAISQGRVLQRRWVSAATRALREVETLVTFAKGKVWSQGRIEKAVADRVPRDAAERQDRHFLPYRREW